MQLPGIKVAQSSFSSSPVKLLVLLDQKSCILSVVPSNSSEAQKLCLCSLYRHLTFAYNTKYLCQASCSPVSFPYYNILQSPTCFYCFPHFAVRGNRTVFLLCLCAEPVARRVVPLMGTLQCCFVFLGWPGKVQPSQKLE